MNDEFALLHIALNQITLKLIISSLISKFSKNTDLFTEHSPPTYIKDHEIWNIVSASFRFMT